MHRWLVIAWVGLGCTDSLDPDTDRVGPVGSADDSDLACVSASLGAIAFGEQRLGAQAAPREVQLTNTTAMPVEFLDVLAIPEDQGFFVDIDPTGTRVEPGATRRLPVRWRPLRRGEHAGELVVETSCSPAGEPMRLPLSGFGTAGVLRAEPASVVFARDVSSRVAITLSNPGDAAVRLTEARVDGAAGLQVDLDPGRNGEPPLELPPIDPELGVPVRTVFIDFDPERHDGRTSAEVVLRNNGYLDSERVITVTFEGS